MYGLLMLTRQVMLAPVAYDPIVMLSRDNLLRICALKVPKHVVQLEFNVVYAPFLLIKLGTFSN
jgi:hypothetical protein